MGSSTLSQMMPPKPKFTEANMANQAGKVFIVTGATAGVGKALGSILFSLDATVYLGGRSSERGQTAIDEISAAHPNSNGSLHFLEVDLEDLESVRQGAKWFLARETRLDALWNNAAVMFPPAGTKTKQGYELQLGVNMIAAYLFTRLLTPILKETARTAEPGAVRVMWVSSSAAELFSPPGGIDMDNLDYKKDKSAEAKYAMSKGGMIVLAQEYAKQHKQDGIISIPLNPGNLKTDLRRHLSWPVATIFGWMSYDAKYGAYTELYAAFSKDITLEDSGRWVIPWGRSSTMRKDIVDSSRPVTEGGTGVGQQLVDWCDQEIKQYLE